MTKEVMSKVSSEAASVQQATKSKSESRFLNWGEIVSALAIVGLMICYRDYERAVKDLVDARHELNITKNCRGDILVFNRVPKVGSVTMKYLVGVLREENDFKAFSSLDMMPVQHAAGEDIWYPDETSRKQAVKAIIDTKNKSSPDQPFVFVKHHNFFDFSEFGYHPSPVYMNFVRHPVERIISWYYYVRAPWYQLEENKYNQTILKHNWKQLWELKVTFEECVRNGWRKCRIEPGISINSGKGHAPDYVSQMSFFCGHSPECDTLESEAMFKLAVANVDKYYAVVGVLEEWQKSLAVLEAFLPRFFRGARKLLDRPEYKEIRHLNANIFKPKTDPAMKRELEVILAREMDFYHYCRQRLRKQYELVEEEYG